MEGFLGFETEKETVKQEVESRPVCPVHYVEMRSYCSKTSVTYSRCPVDGCNQTAKSIRPKNVIPKTPHVCARCNVPLVVSSQHSNKQQIALICESCGVYIKIARVVPLHPASSKQFEQDIIDL